MAAVQSLSRYRWVILFLAILSQWSAALAGLVLPPLAPLFMPELGLTKAEVGLFSSAAFAGALAVLLVAGSLTDRFGVRRMMSWGQVVTGFLLLSMSLVTSVFQAAAVMFAAGVGRGTVFPGASKAILDWFPPSRRATAMGLKQTGMPLGGIITAATLPAIGLALGWRAAVATAGVVIILCGLISITLYRELPHTSPVAPRRPSMLAGLKDTIHNRRIWMVGFIGFLSVMNQQSLLAYLALFFKEVVLVPAIPEEGTRIIAAGGFLAFCQSGGVLGRVLWGMASDRIFKGRRAVVLAILALFAASTTLALANLGTALPMPTLYGFVFILGLAVVGWNGVYHALLTEVSGRKYAATGVGLGMTMTEVGSVSGPPIFGLIVDLSGSYTPAWLFLASLSLGASLVALLSWRWERKPIMAV